VPCSLGGVNIDINSTAVLDPSKAGQQKPDPPFLPPAEITLEQRIIDVERRLTELEMKVE
jgi:hypothetical protein